MLQIGAALLLLQIRANVVRNWGSFIITIWGKCCYKLVYLLQIRATVITNTAGVTNWAKMYCKLGQVLQIRALITNWGITLIYIRLIHINNIVTLTATKENNQVLILN